jgi:hypothetical protein
MEFNATWMSSIERPVFAIIICYKSLRQPLTSDRATEKWPSEGGEWGIIVRYGCLRKAVGLDTANRIRISVSLTWWDLQKI